MGDFNVHFKEHDDISWLNSDSMKEDIVNNFIKNTNMKVTNNYKGIKENLCKNRIDNNKVASTRFCKEHNSNIKKGTTIDYVLIEYNSKIFD